MSDLQHLTPRYILQWFSPRWFIFVMGTGALANVYQLLSGGTGGLLHLFAQIFLTLAMMVFALAAVLMIVRLFVGLDCIMKELRHASLIQFYAAISIAAAVCATGLMNVPLAYLSQAATHALVRVFWWIALIDGLFFAVFTPYQITVGHHAQPRRALGFWFLSPVGLFVLVFAGNFWAMHMAEIFHVRSMLFLNTAIMGIAIPLTIIFYTIIVNRHLFYNTPRRDVAPSFMIGVAPAAVWIVAMNTFLPVLKKSGVDHIDPVVLGSIVKIASLLLWGFGFWWLIYALAMITRYLTKLGVPVTLGYWAFIFPPAAYTIATLILAKSLGIALLQQVAIVLAIVVSLWWLVNVTLTIRGILNRSIFDVAPTFKGDIPYL